MSLAAASMLAGCGGAGSSKSNQAPGPAATTAQNSAVAAALTCELVPGSTINAALGTDVGNPTQSTGGEAIACEFNGKKAGTVMIRIQKGDDATAFAVERKTFDTSGQPTKDF